MSFVDWLRRRNEAAFERQVRSMTEWCQRHANNKGLRAWLATNPPPPEWEGTDVQWAYTEMPAWNMTPETYDKGARS